MNSSKLYEQAMQNVFVQEDYRKYDCMQVLPNVGKKKSLWRGWSILRAK
jgi:hypothetical protein